MSEWPVREPAPAPPPPAVAPPRRSNGAALLLVGAVVGGIVGGAIGVNVGQRDGAPGPAGAVFPGIPLSSPSAPSSAPPATGDAVVDVVREVGQSVVTVVAKSGRGAVGSGSGFVVDAQRGYILTNNHVVTAETGQALPSFDVIFSDDKTVSATLVGRDEETDVAVLRVDGGASLKAAAIGDSDAIPVGAQVVTIGSPLGEFKNTVTAGVLSAKGRRVPAENSSIFLEDLLQTDAPISPGNSGGPLIWAATKQVVGMNTLVTREAGSEGLGFAISSKTFRQIADELIRNGNIQRGKIGISAPPLTPRTAISLGLPATAGGAIITRVVPGSPAAQAGLRENDVIVKVNDQQIDEQHPLQTVMLKYRPGDRITLTIFRAGQQQTVEITLGRG